jgi:hypothetical protein
MLGRHLLSAALAVTVAGCGDIASPAARSPHAPRLTVGPTVSVVVSCPSNLLDGQSGQCSAAGYDSMGQFTGSTASWSTTTSTVLGVSGSGLATAVHLASGTGNVSATIGGVTGQASITVTQSDLAISIGGPSSIRPNTLCYWWSTVTGGTAGYTYSWSQSPGSATSSASDFHAQGSSAFTVYLTVTDALGTWRTTSQAVSVSSTAHVCPT